MNCLNLTQIKQLLEQRDLDNRFQVLKDIPQPFEFKDIQKATERIIQAINNNEPITIVGDYDADGVTSTAIMIEFFKKALNIDVKYIIPNRFTDGYGISINIVDKIQSGIIITVDNGISSIEAAQKAQEKNIDLIITDHHTVSDNLPSAYAIVNPKQNDCLFPFEDICGANVAWYLCANIKKTINLQYDMMELFDLLTIAIIADIMPMVSLNKTIVKKGLQFLSTSSRPAIVALRQRYNFTNITEEDIGFKIAPLINCAGRMEDANIALEFLLSDTITQANEILDYLQELNERRKQEQLIIFEEAKLQVNENDKVIVVASEDWNEGIIGIVASKLCDKYNKPSFVFSIKDKFAKGSARSVGDINLYDLISSVSDLTVGFGGHKGAAGVLIEYSLFENFKNMLTQNLPQTKEQKEIDALCSLNLSLVDKPLFDLINSFRPFGLHNPLPIFLFENLKVENIRLIGKEKQYQKLIVTDGNYYVDVLVFVDIKQFSIGETISFTATISKNEFYNTITYNLMLKKYIM